MKGNRFEVFTSILIAITTICGALTAWRANTASNTAEDADFAGLSALIQAQEAEIVNNLLVYEHYRAFTSYTRYNALGDQVSEEFADADRERSEHWGVALGLEYTFFPTRYIKPDGSYNVQRELDELWAESNSLADLDSQAHFDQAQTFRDKDYYLTATLIVFAIAFFFFTVAQVVKNVLRFPLALLGVGALLLASLAVLFLEFA